MVFSSGLNEKTKSRCPVLIESMLEHLKSFQRFFFFDTTSDKTKQTDKSTQHDSNYLNFCAFVGMDFRQELAPGGSFLFCSVLFCVPICPCDKNWGVFVLNQALLSLTCSVMGMAAKIRRPIWQHSRKKWPRSGYDVKHRQRLRFSVYADPRPFPVSVIRADPQRRTLSPNTVGHMETANRRYFYLTLFTAQWRRPTQVVAHAVIFHVALSDS